MVETKTGLIIIASITFVMVLIVIIASCNVVHPEFDNVDDREKYISEKCTAQQTQAQFVKCSLKYSQIESLCDDLFWWLRY